METELAGTVNGAGGSPLGWDKLFMNGSVVDLDVGIWAALTRIRPQDLGIEDNDDVNKALSLGSTRLVPKGAMDEIKKIADAAQRTVSWYSLQFPFVRGARYVPANKYDALIERLKKHRDAFDEAVDRFVQSYSEAKAEMLPVIRAAFQEASKNPISAECAYIRIQAEYPTEEQVRQKFRLTWSSYAIRSAQDQQTAEAAAQEAETVKSMVQSMVVQLRTEFAEKVSAIMSAVAKGGKIPANVAASVNDVLARIDGMNVFEDRQLAKQVAALREIIRRADEGAPSRGQRDLRETTQLVTDLVTIQNVLDKSVEDAVRDAEAALTRTGQRKIDA